MIMQNLSQALRHAPRVLTIPRSSLCLRCSRTTPAPQPRKFRHAQLSRPLAFHTSSRLRAQSPTADALMENLNDLYATAKDEFEIASEETDKKTVYAADDREGAKEALEELKAAFESATTESDPEVAKEIQSRVGSRIRELENAVQAMEQRAMED